MAQIHVIDRSGQSHNIEGKTGQSVMLNLTDHDFGIEAICGGCCSCATCHVYVDAAWADRLPPRDDMEQALVSETEHYQENSRLSCQIEFTDALDGLSLIVAPEE